MRTEAWGTFGARSQAWKNPGLGTPRVTWALLVVGTGVDPVTSRFSGARSTN
jgi:hypothetical protein